MSNGVGEASLELQLANAIEAGDLAEVKALLSKGAKVDGGANGRMPPFVIACLMRREAIALALIEHGLDVDAAYSKDVTPVSLAVANRLSRVFAELASRGAKGAKQAKPPAPPKLPAEYVKLLPRFRALDNRRSSILPYGRDTQHVRFVIDGELLVRVAWIPEDAIGDLEDVLGEKRARELLLLAVFDANGEGQIDSAALLVDRKRARCPVFLYEDGNLEQVAVSLAAFLDSLVEPHAGAPTA
jgi:hypothetical protein